MFGLLDLTVLILGETDNPRADECDDNTIYKLPERLLDLKWLVKLDAPNVMLLELPCSIGCCKGLTHLDVHSNSVSLKRLMKYIIDIWIKLPLL